MEETADTASALELNEHEEPAVLESMDVPSLSNQETSNTTEDVIDDAEDNPAPDDEGQVD